MGSGLRLHRASTGEQVAADDQSHDQVLAFSPSGEELYTTGGEGVQVRRRASLQVVRSFSWQVPNRFLGVSPHGRLVVSTGGETLFYDPDRASGGYVERRLPVALDAISWPDNGHIEVGTARDGRYFHAWRSGDQAELCAPAAPVPAVITAAASSPDGSWVALARKNGVVEVANVHRADEVVSLPTGRQGLIRLAVSNDGRRLATLAAAEPRNPSGDDASCYGYGASTGFRPLEVFDVPSGRKLQTLALPESFCDFVLSGDGQLIAHTDGAVRIETRHVYLGSHVRVVAVETGAEALRIGPTEAETTARGGTYTLHGFSPEGARLAVGTSGAITIYWLVDGSVERIHPDLATGRMAAVSPDWSLLASRHGEGGPHGGKFRVLDMADGAPLATFDVGSLSHIALSDSWAGATVSQFQSASQYWNAFKVWDVPSGRLLRFFRNTVPLPVGPDRLVTHQGDTNLALWCR
jgi:hypothetical protein